MLDADGLNALEGDPAPLRRARRPHRAHPARGRVRAARRRARWAPTACAAARARRRDRRVTLLKGPGTVVAAPGGRPVAINPTGGPALATAGTGDVLSGIVGGARAPGAASRWAAAAAAFVHGRAAETAGHTGLVAGDLIDALARVLDELDLDDEAMTRERRASDYRPVWGEVDLDAMRANVPRPGGPPRLRPRCSRS